MKKGLILIGISVLAAPIFAFAQININLPFALENELNVEIVPAYPRPNESVFLTLTMYTADLDSADIAWLQNGRQMLIGTGLKQFSFVAGDPGETTNIEIRVRLKDGTVFSKKVAITPAGVDLFWEADAYVPPFYKGKALHPRQGKLKIVAMPEFFVGTKRIPSSNLIYNWSNGTRSYQSQSGYGRNVLVIDGALLGSSERISVVVQDPQNNITAQGNLSIPTTDPEIVFYENDPYYGYIFDKALLGSFELPEEEVEVVAFPYYFTKENLGLEYNWRLNGQAAPELAGSRTAVFRKPEGQAGQSLISLNVKSPQKILQFADGRLTISFDE